MYPNMETLQSDRRPLPSKHAMVCLELRTWQIIFSSSLLIAHYLCLHILLNHGGWFVHIGPEPEFQAKQCPDCSTMIHQICTAVFLQQVTNEARIKDTALSCPR